MVTSTAVNSLSTRQEGADAVVDAARYSAVGPLVDSLLHDARNPLNAISINLEVLSEKLKLETGQVPPGQEKNLRAMREQVQRVDALLRRFADYLQHTPAEAGVVDLGQGVERTLEVLGYECRRRRIELKTALEADVRARLVDTSELSFLVVQPLLRAVQRLGTGGSLSVTVRAEGERALLQLADGLASAHEPAPEAMAALALMCDRQGVGLQLAAGSLTLAFRRG